MKLRRAALFACSAMCVVALTSCKDKNEDKTYTYRTTMAIEPTNFNPHTWETNTDSIVAGYAETGFVEPIYDVNSEDGAYTWAYEMATAIEDYTPNATAEELAKWGIEEGETNRMYKISLNPDAKWADGTPINADTYVYSMEQLLNPKMHNYRANNYVSGDSSIAGASTYYWSGHDEYVALDKYLNFPADGRKAVIDVTSIMSYGFGLAPNKVKGSGYDSYLKLADGTYLYDKYEALFTDKCRMELTLESLSAFIADFSSTSFWAVLGMASADAQTIYDIVNKTEALTEEEVESLGDAYYFISVPKKNDEVEYDGTVGLYKVDEYTIMYVLNYTYSEFYFKMSMSGNWLVYEPLYEAGKSQSGEMIVTNYGTSAETYMSFGPYKLDTYEVGKQMRFTRNEYWYGYSDGKHEGQYQTDAIVIDKVSEHATALLGFEQGLYDDVGLNVDDMQIYGNSDYLKAVNTTYTWRLTFNTDLNTLKNLEKDGTNKQVLANQKFREAFSLAIDRQKFVNEAVGAGSPAYYLINSLYMYDVENNPSSVYRNTEAAMKAVVDLYGIEYGAGKEYATLQEAYKAISGYDLDAARALMQEAYEECVANQTYTPGQKISLDLIVTSRDSISEAARKDATVLDAFLKEAIKGTGFEQGGIELNAKNLSDYYNKLLNGQCEMIFAAWGGAVYWPYSVIQCYVNDTELSTQIHEGACWAPEATNLTLTLDFDGDGVAEEKTMTYNEWGTAINSGEFANASFDLKNQILAAIESGFLGFYYCVPLYCDASVSLDSKRLNYITDEYNLMYGFGGLRFLTYHYSDQEWDQYVKDNGGVLNYK